MQAHGVEREARNIGNVDFIGEDRVSKCGASRQFKRPKLAGWWWSTSLIPATEGRGRLIS